MLWRKVESGCWKVPAVFKTARLVMLPKPGAKSLEPLQRRLITLLPIHYLAWSSARFQALQKWQLATFPTSLVGGVAGRKTSDAAHHIAIHTELAIANKQPWCGLKLDRSKCFDRVSVPVTAAIAKALGCHGGFIDAWAQMYDGNQKFLCIGGFIDPSPLANNNGVSQGDCISVLAINCIMTAWCLLMSVISSIVAFVYIDDAYLMTHNVDDLAAAVKITELFDTLVGQSPNLAKSCVWATTKEIRKQLASKLPHVPLDDFFSVLGGYVKSSSKAMTVNATSMSHLIKMVLGDIQRLPINFRQKAFLIASKAMARITYLPEMCPWPRLTMDSFVATVMRTLWGHRPHWRSSELIFAHCTNPVRVHPACAYFATAVCNLVNRCRCDAVFYGLWCRLCASNSVVTRGLLDTFVKAMPVLGIEFCPPDRLRILGSSVSFFDFTPRMLRRVLGFSSAQALFAAALSSKRKDLLRGGSGMLDTDLAPPWVRAKPWRDFGGYDEALILGPMSGACPTADRLYHAKLVDTPKCRWCSCDHETIHHLTKDCPGIKNTLGDPKQMFDVTEQPLFLSHGIFQVPQHLVDVVRNTETPLTTVKAAVQPAFITLWGDGSVYNGTHTFSKTLGFSVVDETGAIRCQQGFSDPFGCSYKAELLALLHAVQMFEGRVHFITDCKALTRALFQLCPLSELPDNLAYRDLWQRIFSAVGFGENIRLSIEWIKAHQVDSVEYVQCLKLRNNKIADGAAKAAAMSAAPVKHTLVDSWRFHLLNHRAWLCKLTREIAKQAPASGCQHDDVVDESVCPAQFQPQPMNELQGMINRYPKWDWSTPDVAHGWRMMQNAVNVPKRWTYSNDLWHLTLAFWQRRQWKCEQRAVCSIYELAYLFWHETRVDPPTLYTGTEGTFLIYVNWLRHFLRTAKHEKLQIFSADVAFNARKAAYYSQTFPYGTFEGGRPFVSNEVKLPFARFVSRLPNNGKTAQDWAVRLNQLPWWICRPSCASSGNVINNPVIFLWRKPY